MKKLLIIAMAVALCFTFTAPAMAKVSIYGWITSDLAYQIKDCERLTAGPPTGVNGQPVGTPCARGDQSITQFTSPRTANRLGVRYKNDDGSVIGRIELRGGTDGGSARATTPLSGDADLHWNYAYVMWTLNPMWRLQIGRQAQTFAIMAPGGAINWQSTRTALLVGFGNVHGGSSRDGIKALVKFSDTVRAEFQLLDPNNLSALTLTIPSAIAGQNAAQENTLPRFDAAVNIKAGNFVIEPSFSYLVQEFENGAAGSDDDFAIWGLALGAKAGFGPLSFAGEITYGENLGAGSYNVGGSAPYARPRAYVDTAGFTRISDSEGLFLWLKGAYNFGPATAAIAYGWQNTENDGNPNLSRVNDADEYDIDRWSVLAWVSIKLAKGFTMAPTYSYQNLGSDEVWGPGRTTGNTDFGIEQVLGIQFSLKF
jgi:hypothetical protein